jgi:DNA polymerase elongation subunit (family B)
MRFYTNVFRRGRNLLVRGYNNGTRFETKVPYKPKLFIPSSEGDWKTIYGQPLKPVNFDSMKAAKEFTEKYADISNFSTYGLNLYEYVYLHENYSNEYDTTYIRTVNIDIEVASENGFPHPDIADQEVTAITVKFKDESYVFGCGDFINSNPKVHYFKCVNEQQLLTRFVKLWKDFDPDIVTGWNIEFFDIPYLHNRLINLFGEHAPKKLSPWGIINTRKTKIYNREQVSYELMGISTLDYLNVYRKFTYANQESYKLDHIAHIELDERKLDISEHATLHKLYINDYQKFIEYNIKDVDLVDRLEKKLKLIEMVLVLAYDAKVNYSDTFTQVRMWDVLIHNRLYDQKIAIPQKEKTEKHEKYAGAYVQVPVPGMYDYVASFDLDGLYPHLIMGSNISPDTLIETGNIDITIGQIMEDSFKNTTSDVLAANGYYFKRDVRGFLPDMLEDMYNSRARAKVKMLEAETELVEIEKKLSKYE